MAQRPFSLDPLAAEWDDEIFDVLSEQAGVHLYPIGEAFAGTCISAWPRTVLCTGVWMT
jgi:hypothetical protein